MDEKSMTAEQAQRYFAVKTNGETWDLLGRATRTPAEDELLVQAAHASLYHWMKCGTPVEHQRGTWLMSRVYCTLGRKDPALRYAKRCAELTREHAALMKDFDLAYAAEALARANAVAGNLDEARKHLKAAESAGAKIADPEDKKIFDGDLNSGDWHGVR